MLISPEIPHESSQLIVLGRGISLEEGVPCLGEGSVERADFAAGYYHGRPEIFQEDSARIICSGGRPRLSEDGQEFGGASEASMMADILMKYGIPHGLIETEPDSRSTLQNFLYSAPMIDQGALSWQRPLGIVSHAGHLRRATDMAHKVLGSDTPLDGLITPGEEGRRWETQERVMRHVWRTALRGINEGDTTQLLAREMRITRAAAALRRPLSLVIR